MKLKNKTFSIITLGCRVNLFETNIIINQMKEEGAILVDNDGQIIIINTCSVTNKADSKSKYFINKACKNTNCELVCVCGCYSQGNSEDIANDKVRIIIGTKYKKNLVELIKELKPKQKIIKISDISKEKEFEHSQLCSFSQNTRSFIKIQDGCNFKCSYCLINQLRGPQRSLDHNLVIKSIIDLVNNGYKEIVLTGVNTAGYNDNGYKLLDLIKEINELKGEFRIRISSLEPFQLEHKTIDIICKNKDRFCQFFHICIQSACDKTLKDMNRIYSVEKFISLCKYIRKQSKYASITTDYIVGFPTETKQDFNISLSNLKKIKFCDMHIFPYSPRKNTPALLMKNIVREKEKTERFNIVKSLNKKLQAEYLKQFINKTVNVLFEKPKTIGIANGHSEYFFSVNVKTKKDLVNQLHNVKITKVINGEVYGILII
jgi:threonylcarbamoyladenosine tRNA methylthiotransferase MtaB